MLAQPGETVKRGQQIATVGTGNARYFTHLHFECANSSRHSSARGIAKIPAAGLMESLSSSSIDSFCHSDRSRGIFNYSRDVAQRNASLQKSRPA
jgi:murein DD-endopeptidase MepM/ murein hydrolase activator NlpD